MKVSLQPLSVPAVPCPVPGLLLTLVAGAAVAQTSPHPIDPTTCVVGRTYRVSSAVFQFLGTTPAGRGLWLYPHVDGVHEVFEVAPNGRWEGDLESTFDPRTGRLTHLFNAAEVLNELVDGERDREYRRRAARLLGFYLELHGPRDPPYYLRDDLRTIDGLMTSADREWVGRRLHRRHAILSRVPLVGTRVSGLQRSGSPGTREYYRRMVADGYLDIAVVGGNLQNTSTGAYRSWPILQELRQRLSGMSFEHGSFRSADDAVRATRVVSLLDQLITVRVLVTGGSRRPARIRRAVANFIEGLAHADVVIYHGHSNRPSGSYYTSETRSPYSRFRIGLGREDDLHDKLHGLKSKAYQIVALQSCSSYDQYCRPVGRFFARELRSRPGETGFMGLSDKADFDDFLPRYSAFLEMLLDTRAPRDMLARLNGLRSRGQSPPFVMRGVLQARYTFIVPEGIDIRDVKELPARRFNLVRGTGSDGKVYYSSEVFTQNEPGGIIQVIPFPRGVYGLHRSGRLFFVGVQSDGAMQESYLTKRLGLRLSFVAHLVYTGGRRRMCLLGQNGKLHVVRRLTPGVDLSRRQAPPGVRFVAVGNDADGRFVAEDARGRFHVWNSSRREYEPAESELELENVTPSLLGNGTPGTIWEPPP